MTTDDASPLPEREERLPLLEELPEGHRSGFVALVGRPNV
ncbi:MAG: GTPase Era, partial [Chloroflexi bacterium]|nr:GTPase Era [Chloroflexota bacterium]